MCPKTRFELKRERPHVTTGTEGLNTSSITGGVCHFGSDEHSVEYYQQVRIYTCSTLQFMTGNLHKFQPQLSFKLNVYTAKMAEM